MQSSLLTCSLSLYLYTIRTNKREIRLLPRVYGISELRSHKQRLEKTIHVACGSLVGKAQVFNSLGLIGSFGVFSMFISVLRLYCVNHSDKV